MKGKRAKVKVKVKEVPTTRFEEADRVEIEFDGDTRAGKVMLVERDLTLPIKVRLDKVGDEVENIWLNCEPKELKHQMCGVVGCTNRATKKDGFCDACRKEMDQYRPENEPEDTGDSEGATDEELSQLKGGNEQKEQKGFNQYGIKWNADRTSFKFGTSEGVDFYGWWRKTRQRNSDTIAWCIDMYAKRTDDRGIEREFPVESLAYIDKDPRESMKSLNADICAAGNKWFFHRIRGNGKMLDDLVKSANTPTVKINRLETIDRLLLKLREYRDTAIRCGGERLVSFHGDRDGGPEVNIILNLTAQAMALEGKVPALLVSAGYDAVLSKGGERIRIESQKPSVENVEAIVAQLNRTKDKGEQRRLRGLLRKMGHRGGARSINKVAAQKSGD